MERPKEERPSHPRRPRDGHHQFMREQHSCLIRSLRNSKCVIAMKPRWASELEAYGSPWLIRIHHIAHRPVPSRCADTKRSVQSHRRPLSTGPQPVMLSRQGVQQVSDRFSARTDVSLMNVLDHVLRLTIGSPDDYGYEHRTTDQGCTDGFVGRDVRSEFNYT